MEIWLFAIFGSVLISVFSVAGAFTIWMNESRLKRVVPFLVSMAVGVLLGDAFVHLLPDANELLGSFRAVSLYTAAGILLFFALEKAVRWRHDHSIGQSAAQDGIKPLAKMNLIGDAVHNFTDGALIAGSFLASPALGVTTTIAIIAHEIPQEIGDVGALIYGGYKPRRAVWLNFLCSLTCPLGAVSTLILGTFIGNSLPFLLPVAAGGFIYIAVSDLMPALHYRSPVYVHIAQVAIIAGGIQAMSLVGTLENLLK
ncbi:MAG: ZIP family metal transporter [Deltaproteobacteria bacterium]